MLTKIANRIKSWWKYSTPMEKINFALDVICIAGTAYCANKIENKIDHAFDRMDIHLHLTRPADLQDPVEPVAIKVEANGPEAETGLVRDEKKEEEE